MKRKWVIPVAVILVLLLVFAGWRTLRRRSARAATSYATTTVDRGTIEVTVTNTGTLVSGVQQDLRLSTTATTDEVLVKVGDHVKKGQVLARLSNPDLLVALDQARANLKAEEQRLADMVSPRSTATENEIKNAKYRVSQAEYTLSERRKDVAGLTVQSPVSGLVASIPVNVHDQIAGQATLASILDLNALTLSTTVSQWAADSMHLGDTASVSVNGAERVGRVVSITPSATGSVETGVKIPITIALDPVDGDDYIRPGMIGYYVMDRTELEGSGSISARTYTVRSRTAASVDAISVSVGDMIEEGDTIMSLVSDAAILALEEAELNLDNARTALNDLLTPPVTATATEITSEEAKLAQVRAAYESALADVEDLTVVAPFDGVVTACSLSVGSRVAANASTAMFTVADFSQMSVKINVDELDVADLQVGMEAIVDVPAKPGQTYQAKISSISPLGTVSQGVATYPVELQLTDPKDLLAGMTANVTITCDRRDDVLYVPVEAVQTMRGRSFVRVLGDDRKATNVEVTTGLANDLYIEIVSGLSEGQTVITGTVSGNNGLRFPGMGMGPQSGDRVIRPNGGR
ncbi:MAG: efflux RND transporter periplasmic adaptor subunit [Chloroflexota bacterium]